MVLISMATSSGDDMPRNIEFLYSRNRLNVAISRARCLSVCSQARASGIPVQHNRTDAAREYAVLG